MKLSALFSELDRCSEAVPIDLLCDRLRRLEIDDGTLADHIHFGDSGYRRNLVHLGPGYAALVLCWRPGQASPLHDHQGSACALRVIRGVGSEKRYNREAAGRLVEACCNTYRVGQVCGTYDADIHTMFNAESAESDLVTLHVYTPPMRSYRAYCLDTGEVRVCSDAEVLAEERRRVAG